jgi:hypothetical protein
VNKAKVYAAVSFGITTAAAFPYLAGVWRGEFQPNLNGWVLWTLIGLVMLLSYRSAGAEENILVGVVAFTNPLAVTVLVLWKRGGWATPDALEMASAFVCVSALMIWGLKHRDQRYAKLTLVMSIIADIGAAIPTLRVAWYTPLNEQPIPWGMYCVAMVFAFLAITKKTWDQYALPAYGLALGISMTLPTVIYRLLHHIPFFQWL